MELVFTLSTIQTAVDQLWAFGQKHYVWAFHGEMGAGKTTFIHALCAYLGVSSTVGSPTYSIINEYNSGKAGIIYHMDWYRLKDEEEAMQAGVEDALFSGERCFVEWPERAASLLPAGTLHIYLRIKSDIERTIEVEIDVK